MIRKAFLGFVLAASLHAETVYLAAHGKTFHSAATCMALSRTPNKLTSERKAAEAHGLKPCGLCYRPKTAKKPANSEWAKGGK